MIWQEGLVLVLAGKGFRGGSFIFLAGASYFGGNPKFWRELACRTLVGRSTCFRWCFRLLLAFLPNEKSGNSLHYLGESGLMMMNDVQL